MKNPNLRSHLLIGLTIIVSFIAAWLPISLVRGGRAAQDGLISGDLPQEPPADELRAGPYSTYNNPRLAGPDDPVEAMIELEAPPAIEAFAQEQGAANFAGEASSQAVAAARSQIARIEQAQQKLARVLTGPQFKARITASVQRVYNGIALQVASGKLAEIRAMPGVKAVHLPELIYPATDTSVPFIGANQVWGSAVVSGQRGEGIIVAVIDSGIDYTHANLGGSGLTTVFNSNNPTIIGDVGDFPNAKVIGGVDLVGDNYNAADPNNNTPNPDPDPVDCKSNGHGTGTASIAAGVGVNANGTAYTGSYVVSTNFSSFRIGPGVAPKANLYAIRVFGCNAFSAVSNAVMTQAIDRAMDPNQDGNFSDRARVVLLPGGGPFSTLPNSPMIAAINNGALANVIYVGAAGNGGDTHLAAGGPALAEGALAVVANADNGLFAQNIRVNTPGNIAGSYPGAVTEFGFPLSAAYTRPAVYAQPNDGCAPLTNGSQVNGNIAFIDRGTCTLTTKARNAQAAGAVALIIGNNTASLPASVGDDGTGSDITITSFLLAQNGGDAIRQELNGGQTVNVTLTPGDVTFQPGLANSYASFNPYGGIYASTSRGPRNDILKPDIAAPGTNIGSAKVGSGNNFFYFTGTSSAAPHVAGTVALLRQKFPDATSRSIYDLVRSTSTGVFSGANSAPPERGPSLVGGGGVNAQAAATTNASVNSSQTISATNLYGEVIEATSTQTIQPKISLEWKGSSALSYSTTNNFLATIPGVTCTNTNPTGTVPPNSIFNLNYVCGINPAALKRQCSPWVSPTQSGNARHCLPEFQGSTIFNFAGSNLPVKTQIYLGLRPASQMGTAVTSLNLANPTGTISLTQTGQGVNNGSTLPIDWRSFLSPSELQWIDPNDALTPPELDYFDLQYIGVRKAANRLIFVLSAHEDWRSPNEVRHNVFIDTNRDGRDDFHLFTTSFPNAQGAPSDVQITRLFNINTGTFASQTFFINSFSPATLDSALYYTNVISLPVDVSLLGGTLGKFDYTVKTSFGNVVVDESARLTYDAANPGLDFGTSTMFNDLPGGTIPISYNLNNFRAANSEGALLLHHFNTRGNRAQILPANLGREADVDPRTGGNGSNTNADWVQLGRFAAGLDDVNLGNEFQRADCAPRTTSGNGALTVSDWVQAGRYAAGLDPVASTSGPVIPTSGSQPFSPDESAASPENEAGQTRTLRALNANFIAGQTNSLDIELDALGDENAVGFSLNYDPTALSFVSAHTGSAASGASLLVNTSQTANGRVGVALALPAGQGLQAGARRIATIRFDVVTGASVNTTPVNFGDQPIARQMANVNADALTANYANAAVTIARAVASVSAASFTGASLASESIVAAFGVSLATRVEVANTLPLPTTLAGTTVKVKDSAGVERAAPLFFVAPGQVNFLIPPGTTSGAAMITIASGDGAISMGNVNITTVAPGIFAANANGQGVAAATALRVKADGTRIFEPVARFDAAQNRFVSIPIDLGPDLGNASDQVFLLLFGTGLRFLSAQSAATCSIGGVNSEVLFAGAQGDFVGLDQMNVRLARSLIGSGEVDLVVTVDGNAANTARINVK
ncbi:MAG: S8 family serine peptidase [Blastocatellales bacterium]